MKFRKKSELIEAYQWFVVSPYIEGVKRDVDYYRHPLVDGQTECDQCSLIMHDHGWIDAPNGGRTVCPKDWIIDVEWEKFPLKPLIFEAFYEAAE